MYIKLRKFYSDQKTNWPSVFCSNAYLDTCSLYGNLRSFESQSKLVFIRKRNVRKQTTVIGIFLLNYDNLCKTLVRDNMLLLLILYLGPEPNSNRIIWNLVEVDEMIAGLSLDSKIQIIFGDFWSMEWTGDCRVFYWWQENVKHGKLKSKPLTRFALFITRNYHTSRKPLLIQSTLILISLEEKLN